VSYGWRESVSSPSRNLAVILRLNANNLLMCQPPHPLMHGHVDLDTKFAGEGHQLDWMRVRVRMEVGWDGESESE
jgi:hypothetical protein